MQNSLTKFPSKQTIRRLLGVAFMIVLLAEWGSHGLAFSHSDYAEGAAAIHSSDSDHDDPCKTLVRCSDGRQQDPVNVRYDGSSHSFFLNGLLQWRPLTQLTRPPSPNRERIDPLSRPISPPFHPPEIS